jgi:hypothetical protein
LSRPLVRSPTCGSRSGTTASPDRATRVCS